MKLLARSAFADRTLWVVMTGIVICALLPFLGLSDFYAQQAFTLFFYVTLALSWNILGGYTGYLSLGHASFVGVGGYTVACIYFLAGISPFLTFPLAAVAAALLALVIGVICFRVRGSYFLIATMLVLFILQTLAANLTGVTNGADGIDLPLFTSNFSTEARIWYHVALAMAVLTLIVCYAIEHSRFGLNLMAIREDEEVARAMGVRVTRCKAVAFTTSAALAGMIGAFYAYRAHTIEPFSAFTVDLSAAPILMATLGGSRSWLGPVVGAIIFDVVSSTLILTIGNEYSDIFFAVFLIGVVLLLPDGLMGVAQRLRHPGSTRPGIGESQPAPATAARPTP